MVLTLAQRAFSFSLQSNFLLRKVELIFESSGAENICRLICNLGLSDILNALHYEENNKLFSNASRNWKNLFATSKVTRVPKLNS